MGVKTCAVEGCCRELTGRGEGYGMCGMHYQRWHRYSGNVNQGRPLGRPLCTIEGCDKPNVGRGWCSKHWTRWKRYGDPEARLRGEVRNGRKVCSRCESDRLLVYYSPNEGECKFCMADRATAWRQRNPDRVSRIVPTVKPCDWCMQPFPSTGKQSRYCSQPCRDVARVDDNPRWGRFRRERVAAVTVETFTRLEIFVRDNWTCGICSHPIEAQRRHPDPLSPSIDHIVPIARGGTHERSNVQAAHLVCNLRKGTRLLEAVA